MSDTNEPDYIKRRKQREYDAHERDSANRDAQERNNHASAINALVEEVRSYRRDQKSSEPKKLSVDKTAAVAAVIAAILSFGSLIAFICLSIRADHTVKNVSERQLRQEHILQRAFINVTTLRIEEIDDKAGHPQYWKVTPVVENAGATATRGMIFFSGLMKDETAILPFVKRLDPDETEIQFASGIRHTAALGPHATIAEDTYIITPKERQDIDAQNLKIFIIGETRYWDIFDNVVPHETKFCFRLFGNIGNTGSQSLYGMQRETLTTVNGLSARTCFKNNCTDGDCGEYNAFVNSMRSHPRTD